MPIASDPEATFNLVLFSDREKPADVQPRFVYRHLTARQWGKVCETHNGLESFKSDAEALEKVFGACRIGLVGWENITNPDGGGQMPFDADKLEEVLGISEASELMTMIRASGILGADCKKKFDSLSDSDTEQSAGTAPGPKTAKTNPPDTTR